MLISARNMVLDFAARPCVGSGTLSLSAGSGGTRISRPYALALGVGARVGAGDGDTVGMGADVGLGVGLEVAHDVEPSSNVAGAYRTRQVSQCAEPDSLCHFPLGHAAHRAAPLSPTALLNRPGAQAVQRVTPTPALPPPGAENCPDTHASQVVAPAAAHRPAGQSPAQDLSVAPASPNRPALQAPPQAAVGEPPAPKRPAGHRPSQSADGEAPRP